MASGIFVEFDARHHAVVNVLVWGTILARFHCWSCKSNVPKNLYSKCNCAKSTTLGLPAGSKMVLEPRLCSAKKWSCQVVGSHHSCQAIYACVGEGLASHHAVIALKSFVLGTATRKVATVEVARARCPSFSSKSCLSLWTISARIFTGKAAVQESQPPASRV